MIEAFFLPVEHGPVDARARFCVYRAPAAGPVRAAVLLAPPFAEELNKCRRMLALQAQALADAGFAVLQLDLAGCGDSGGELAQMRWDDWIEDLAHAARWLSQRSGAPLVLWGVRAGCLLLSPLWARLPVAPAAVLCWQPSPEGRQVLQQFLRTKVVGDALAGAGSGVMSELKQALAAGEPVTVAGYVLPADLADGLGSAVFSAPAAGICPSIWIEVSAKEGSALSPAGVRAATAWRQAGWQVDHTVVHGPAFWQSTEIETAPALLEATTQALSARLSP